jgi:hypothetical protein
MVLSPEALKASAWLRSMVLSTASQSKALQRAFENLIAAKPESVLGDFGLPLSALKIHHYHDPEKADAAMRRLFDAFEAGAVFQSAPIQGTPQVKRHSQSYRDFQLSAVRMKWNFDKLLVSQAGSEQQSKQFEAALQHIMGNEIETWFGTNGKINVQVTAQDWPSAQRQLDHYLDGKDVLGQQPAYEEVRKHLASEAILTALLDVRRYVDEALEPFLRLYLKEHAHTVATTATPAPSPEAVKPCYLGLAVQVQAERIGFQLWLPGVGAQELYRAYELTLRK